METTTIPNFTGTESRFEARFAVYFTEELRFLVRDELRPDLVLRAVLCARRAAAESTSIPVTA